MAWLFTSRTPDAGARLGEIVYESCDVKIKTPACMLYSRAGSVPYLTKQMLGLVENIPRIVHMPLNRLVEHQAAVEKFGKGIKEFTAMKDYIALMTLQDPAVETPSGYNRENYVSVWTHNGKQEIKLANWLKIAETFRPDLIQVLTDSDASKNDSKKQTKKSMNRNKRWLAESQKTLDENTKMSNTVALATVQCGGDVTERLQYITETSQYHTSVILEGFHNNGPGTEHYNWAEEREKLTKIASVLPEKSVRILPAILSPSHVIHAVEAGVDLFDTSYPYIVTERNCALTFNYDLKSSGGDGNQQAEIDFTQKQYEDDFGPILQHCTCYTCANFNRSYVTHLVNTSELLAGILLMIHNLHHYLCFFEALRSSLYNDEYDKFAAMIQSYNTDSNRSSKKS